MALSPNTRRIAASTLGAALFVAALWAIEHVLGEYDWDDVLASMATIAPPAIFAALAFTAGSYLLLILYDVLALRYVSAKVPWTTTAAASFAANAVGTQRGIRRALRRLDPLPPVFRRRRRRAPDRPDHCLLHADIRAGHGLVVRRVAADRSAARRRGVTPRNTLGVCGRRADGRPRRRLFPAECLAAFAPALAAMAAPAARRTAGARADRRRERRPVHHGGGVVRVAAHRRDPGFHHVPGALSHRARGRRRQQRAGRARRVRNRVVAAAAGRAAARGVVRAARLPRHLLPAAVRDRAGHRGRPRGVAAPRRARERHHVAARLAARRDAAGAGRGRVPVRTGVVVLRRDSRRRRPLARVAPPRAAVAARAVASHRQRRGRRAAAARARFAAAHGRGLARHRGVARRGHRRFAVQGVRLRRGAAADGDPGRAARREGPLHAACGAARRTLLDALGIGDHAGRGGIVVAGVCSRRAMSAIRRSSGGSSPSMRIRRACCAPASW